LLDYAKKLRLRAKRLGVFGLWQIVPPMNIGLIMMVASRAFRIFVFAILVLGGSGIWLLLETRTGTPRREGRSNKRRNITRQQPFRKLI
jgi:hypothetical protein